MLWLNAEIIGLSFPSRPVKIFLYIIVNEC